MDIVLIKVGNDITWAELKGYMGCLRPERQASVKKKANDTDKINALLSRLLVLSEIKTRTGLPEHRIRFYNGSQGKPYIRDCDLQFSLSHTRGAVCAAFSGTEEIGVDVERRDRRVSPHLCDRVLSERERALMYIDEDLLRFWVKKEAFLKRLGVGITRDLRRVDSLTLPDTTVIEHGGLLIGASGRGAPEATISELTVDELLSRYTKLV